MSKQWTIENDTGAELTVRAPNGFAVELDANSADPRERFAYFAIRQQARDLDQLRADLAAAAARADLAERDRDILGVRVQDLKDGMADMQQLMDDGASLNVKLINERDRLRSMYVESTERICSERDTLRASIEDDFSGWRAVERRWKTRAEQAEARLAAIEAAPTVAWQWMDTGHFRKNKPDGALVFDWRPLIARPAKD